MKQVTTFRNIAASLLAVAFLPISHCAAQDSWRQTGGPTGGIIQSLSAADDGTLFAGVVLGGIYRSTDDGNRWQRVTDNTALGNLPRVFAMNDGLVYAGGLNRLFRSTDNGDSWLQIQNDFTSWSMLQAPNDRLFAGSIGEVVRSIDGGESFTPIGPVDSSRSLFNIARNAGGTLFAGSWQDGLHKTNNEGNTWERIDGDLPNTLVRSVQIIGDDSLFVGLERALYLSTDGGYSWYDRSVGLDSSNISAVIRHGDGSLFAQGARVFRSTDGGEFWMEYQGLEVIAPLSIVSTPAATVLLGGEGALLRSSDNGNSWPQSQTGIQYPYAQALAAGEDILYAGTDIGGVYSSSNDGQDWKFLTGREATGLSITQIEVTSRGTVFAANYDLPLLRSTDQGATWRRMVHGLPGNSVTVVTAARGSVYAAAYKGRVFSSDDEGDSWTELAVTEIGGEAVEVLKLMSPAAGIIFAGTSKGVVRSIDDGRSWQQVAMMLDRKYIDILDVDSQGAVYSGYFGELYRSTDGGDTWSQIFDDLTRGGMTSLVVNAKDHLYLSMYHGDVMFSTDTGWSWREFNSGLGAAKIMAMTETAEGHIYAGSRYHGVFATNISTTGTGGNPSRLAGFELLQNHPNPFGPASRSGSPGTTIGFSLKKASQVVLTIYDVLGHQVATPVNGFRSAGTYSVHITSSNLRPGVYFYSLAAGEKAAGAQVAGAKAGGTQSSRTKKMLLIR